MIYIYLTLNYIFKAIGIVALCHGVNGQCFDVNKTVVNLEIIVSHKFVLDTSCDADPCKNGGMCTTKANGLASCTCGSDFRGINCQRGIFSRNYGN